MTDQQPPLDALAEALRVLAAASTYAYDPGAAYEAARAHLDGLDGEQLRETAAAIAALAAEFGHLVSWTRGGHSPAFNLDGWLRLGRCRVAGEDRP